MSRNAVIAGSVVVFHVAALWALQSGLLRRAVEVVVPAQILAEMITPPAPKPQTPPAPVPEPPKVQPKVKTPPPAPMPVAIPDPTPAPAAPTGVVAPQPPAPPVAAPVAAAAPPAPPAPPAPAKVELPSSDAAYLQNPAPVYPAMSKRLQEQGKVIVRVTIGIDGVPREATVRRSSGFERLDRAAVEYVMKCRYVPGKVAGVPTVMAYDAPVNFELTF